MRRANRFCNAERYLAALTIVFGGGDTPRVDGPGIQAEGCQMHCEGGET